MELGITAAESSSLPMPLQKKKGLKVVDSERAL